MSYLVHVECAILNVLLSPSAFNLNTGNKQQLFVVIKYIKKLSFGRKYVFGVIKINKITTHNMHNSYFDTINLTLKLSPIEFVFNPKLYFEYC